MGRGTQASGLQAEQPLRPTPDAEPQAQLCHPPPDVEPPEAQTAPELGPPLLATTARRAAGPAAQPSAALHGAGACPGGPA